MQVSGKTGTNHPDMRDRKQVTVKVTEQFAKDLNLVMASYGLTDVSYVVRQSVAAQANGIRAGMVGRLPVQREGDTDDA